MKFEDVCLETINNIKESKKLDYLLDDKTDTSVIIKLKYKDSSFAIILQEENGESDDMLYICIITYMVRMKVDSDYNKTLLYVNELNKRSALLKVYIESKDENEDEKYIICFRSEIPMNAAIDLNIIEGTIANLKQGPVQLKIEKERKNESQ